MTSQTLILALSPFWTYKLSSWPLRLLSWTLQVSSWPLRSSSILLRSFSRLLRNSTWPFRYSSWLQEIHFGWSKSHIASFDTHFISQMLILAPWPSSWLCHLILTLAWHWWYEALRVSFRVFSQLPNQKKSLYYFSRHVLLKVYFKIVYTGNWIGQPESVCQDEKLPAKKKTW